jgi:hypothetical protein
MRPSLRGWFLAPPLPARRQRARLLLEALEDRLTPSPINIGTSPTDIPLGSVQPGQTLQIRAQVTIDAADPNDPSEGEGFVKMTISGPGFPSVTIDDYGIHEYTVNVSQANEHLTAQLINPPNSDGDEGTGNVEVLPSAKVQVGDKPDKSDNITLYNTGNGSFWSSSQLDYTQKIPVYIYNTGTASATFDVEVNPASAGSLDQSSIAVAPGTPGKLMFTPSRDSGAVDDVHIVAKYDGVKLNEDVLTVVSVTFDPNIFNADTPKEMQDQKAYRIPPGTVNPTTWHITVTPDVSKSPEGAAVQLLVDNNGDGANGSVNLDGHPTEQVDHSMDVNLQGVTQTAPGTFSSVLGFGYFSGGHAGNLRLTVEVRGEKTAKSNGFSVAAIPIDYTDKAIRQVNLGLVVQDGWSSDSTKSTNVSDLSAVDITELVEVNVERGLLNGLGRGNNSDYLSATSFTTDTHSTGVSTIDSAYRSFLNQHWNHYTTGFQDVYQTSAFRDARTGVTGIPMANSGYSITRNVYVSGTTFRMTTTKTGKAVTARGVASGAGAILNPPASVDQFVEVIPVLPHVLLASASSGAMLQATNAVSAPPPMVQTNVTVASRRLPFVAVLALPVARVIPHSVTSPVPDPFSSGTAGLLLTSVINVVQ